ncbi:MAG TPA: hypothetical protein VGM23_12320, partial [Armatimonadota bacterium]
SRTLHRIALSYDWLYNDLTDEQRAFMRNYLVSRIDQQTNVLAWKKASFGRGPSYSGRGCDWSAIWAGGITMACLAVEGESPAAASMLPDAISQLKWIADFSITPEGMTPNGTAYVSTDFTSYFNALHALQRRGNMLIDHPHIKAMPDWLAAEIIPGMYSFDNRNQSSGILSLSTTMVALAARFGGTAEWVQEQALGPNRRLAPDPPGAVAGLIYGIFPDTPPAMPAMSLTRYESSVGTVTSHSGWTPNSSTFTITMEPPGQHHTHPDKGSFTFYSHGLDFACDSGVNHFEPRDHNEVLIDGKGQLGGQGATDAVVRAQLSSSLADITFMDVKSAYERSLAYTETDGKGDWSNLLPGKGLPLVWKEERQLQRVDRYAVFVRGVPDAYAVVLDDVQQDNAPHRYQWLMHSVPTGVIHDKAVTYQSRYGGTYFQAVTGSNWAMFHAKVPTEGDYAVWIMARAQPDLRNFGYFSIARVNRTYSRSFYPGHYLNDWQWYQIIRGDKAEERVWKLPAGTADIELSLKSGGRIAQVLISNDPTFTPDTALTASTEKQIIAEIDPASLAKDWMVPAQPAPRAKMDLFFLQPHQEGLSLKLEGPLTGRNLPQQRLIAEQQAVRAGYAAVLLPSDSSESAPVVTPGPAGSGQTTITRGGVTDYLFANPTNETVPGGSLTCDGKFALVRTRGKAVIGYLLVGGTTLRFGEQTLVKSTAGPVYLVNDGVKISTSAPQGAAIAAGAIGAKNVLCNNMPATAKVQGNTLQIAVPVLKKAWEITYSADGTIVYVVGDGPTPLKVHAPKAIDCYVNGVNVWYSRAPGGDIYPKIDLTVPSYGDDPPTE